MKRFLTMSAIFILLGFTCDSHAIWQGPTSVVSAEWGNGPSQVGLEEGDTGDSFPKSFGVATNGYVVIADPINGFLHVYDGSGTLVRNIPSPVEWEGWPYSVIVNDNCAVVGYSEFTQTFTLADGKLKAQANSIGGADFLNSDCSKVYVKTEAWNIYTTSGELLKSSSEKPLELGVVSKTKLQGGTYRVDVKYPDKVYTITGDAFKKYFRDSLGNIYGISDKEVVKYDPEGKQLGRVSVPEKVFKSADVPADWPEDEERPQPEILEEYGAPLVASNGDVYTWKRTPANYQIVKWVWQ